MSDPNPMVDINAIITHLIEKCIANACKAANSKVKKLIEALKVDCGLVFSEYLIRSYEKYGKIKTLIYKNEPKYLYAFFECNSLMFKNKVIDASVVRNILNLSKLILIRGSAGVGKSTLMRHFFINTLYSEQIIPVFVELRDLNAYEGSLFQYLLCSVNKFSNSLSTEQFERAMDAGFFVFMLDGFDELNQSKYNSTLKELENICDRYNKNYYIISSRPNESLEAFHQFLVLDALPFSKKQAISLISKIEYDSEIKNRFLIALGKELYERHESFASNPLLLNIMLLTFDSCAEIPSKRHIFYSNAFETLYFKHDATKAGFKREMASNLPFDQFKGILAEFCFRTYLQGMLQFTYTDLLEILDTLRVPDSFLKEKYIEDLMNSVCIIHLDAGVYTFTHRSFQEYFVAVYIKSLPDNLFSKACSTLLDCGFGAFELVEMLYDMSQNRFEKIVILPIAKRAEQYIAHDKERYEAFFEYLVRAIYVDIGRPLASFRLSEGKTRYKLLMLAIAYDIINSINPVRDSTDDSTENPANAIIVRKIKTICEKRRSQNQLTVQEIIQDEELNNLIKSSHIGGLVFLASRLHQLISEKYSADEINITRLLKFAPKNRL